MDKFIPTDEQWEKMQRHIKSNKYKKEDFFVFETLAVGDRIVPNRDLKITPALLDIMRQDAQQGVSLMLNHNWSQLGVQSIPIGKVFDARLGPGTQDGETLSLYTIQYILRDDSKVDGYSKNDIINLIESGILADTSIGWGTTRESYKCSICGNCYYDYRKCEHIAGRKYIVNEETNEVKTCIIEAYPPQTLHAGNNVLMENSVVFDGAYPNAIIQSSINNNEILKNGFKTLEGKKQLSEKDIIIGYSLNGNANLLYKAEEEGGKKDMILNNDKEPEEVEEEVVEEVEAVETELESESVINQDESTENSTESAENSTENNEGTTESIETSTELSSEATGEILYTEKDILEKFNNISDNIGDLVILAKEGLNHRNNVISKALESGIHSMGNSFKKDVFLKTFSNLDTDAIEEMGKTWEEEANVKFKKEKVSKQDFSNNEVENSSIQVDMNFLKTGNY